MPGTDSSVLVFLKSQSDKRHSCYCVVPVRTERRNVMNQEELSPPEEYRLISKNLTTACLGYLPLASPLIPGFQQNLREPIVCWGWTKAELCGIVVTT